jgi:hypothetical protein
MRIKCFEDLEIWQEARELCRFVKKITTETPLGKDFKLRDQIRASSGSVMDLLQKDLIGEGTRNSDNFFGFQKVPVVKQDLNLTEHSTMNISIRKSWMIV